MFPTMFLPGAFLLGLSLASMAAKRSPRDLEVESHHLSLVPTVSAISTSTDFVFLLCVMFKCDLYQKYSRPEASICMTKRKRESRGGLDKGLPLCLP